MPDRIIVIAVGIVVVTAVGVVSMIAIGVVIVTYVVFIAVFGYFSELMSPRAAPWVAEYAEMSF